MPGPKLGTWCAKTHAPYRRKHVVAPYNPRTKGAGAVTLPTSTAGEDLLVEYIAQCMREKGTAPGGEVEALRRLCGGPRVDQAIRAHCPAPPAAPPRPMSRGGRSASIAGSAFGFRPSPPQGAGTPLRRHDTIAGADASSADAAAYHGQPRKSQGPVQLGRHGRVKRLRHAEDLSDVGPGEGALRPHRHASYVSQSVNSSRTHKTVKRAVDDIDPDVQTIFYMWSNGHEVIDMATLRAVVPVYTLDNETLEAIMVQYDEDQDGALDLYEFSSMMMVTSAGGAAREQVNLYFQGGDVVTVDQLSQRNEDMLKM